MIDLDIAERIKAERARLGMTQPEFAAAAGAAKRTLIEWEKGTTSPTVVQLSALGSVGVDVVYVLTGQRSVPVIEQSPRERALLDNYRHCAEEDKAAIDRVVLNSASAQQGVGVDTKVKKRAS